MRQQTIRRSASLDGIGLHSGKPTRITLFPAPPDSGLLFQAGPDGHPFRATPESVVDSHYATTLGCNGSRIQTVEHLMAAAAGLGIDNLRVEVEGAEIPAADGSAKPFVALLAAAGRVQQPARRQPIEIPHPIRVGDGGRWIEIVPAPAFRVSYTLDNDHPAIGVQALSCLPSEEMFVSSFAPARTYGFLRDLGTMRKNGLALGGSLDNAIVVGKRGTVNGLRFKDEFVRHKVLDLIGDLALLGRPIKGHVIARNGGHALNFQLVVAVQRALGYARRPAAVAAVAVVPAERAESFAPTPGLATL